MRLTEKTELDIKKSVLQAFDGLVAAAKSLDVERYLGFFDAEKFTSLNEDGTVSHSLDDFGSIIREQFPMLEKYNSLDFENVKVTVINETTAILVNEFSATVQLKSGDVASADGGGTQVWSNTNGDWKLVNVSSCPQG